ncbi:MAG: ABC transporter ATP-binding protein [Candidatus Limivicinus sp.]|jgi:peptide/nickel transport system ATP-binding protein
MDQKNTLEVNDLCTSFFTERGEVQAVNHVSLKVPRGKIVGIVGESGCGKSMTARSVLRLIQYPGRITGGYVKLEGRELTTLNDREMARIRGSEISMIFQEPMTSLNPVMQVGKQITEAVQLHRHVSRREAREEAVKMLSVVGISEPEKRFHAYPHELSGGLRQRVMIAMAMICCPKLLIADEPTTALDVTVEAQILRLIRHLRDEQGTSVLIISHNLGVIAQLCDIVYVMYAGQIVESADTFTLFDKPQHPYTRGLLRAVSSLQEGGDRLDTIPGAVPNLLELPEGCCFSPRCGSCMEKCRLQRPELLETEPGHHVRCHLYEGGES